jgi:hypothetical protein
MTMVKHSIPIDKISKLVVVSVGGNLYLSGWNNDEIQIKDLSNEDLIQTKKDRVEIHFPGDGFIQIPHHLDVEIQSVKGDAVIKSISSDLQIDSVNGDLTISDLGGAKVSSVNGDLIAKRIQGDLQVDNTGGDALVNDVNGQVGMHHVGNDILVEKVAGGIVSNAGGDGTVEFSPVPWQAYQFKVGGDLSVSLPEDCNADLSIQSNANDITIMLGDVDINSRQEELIQQLGEGGPSIVLSAGGKVFLSGDDYSLFAGFKMNMDKLHPFDGDFSADNIKHSLDNLEEDILESFSGLSESLEDFGFSEDNLREFGRKIEESSRMAAEKAEFAAIKAQAKVEKKFAKARLKARKAKAKTKEFDLSKFLDMESEKNAVTENERLLILEMLQEKKISLDEADKLLKALEGKK